MPQVDDVTLTVATNGAPLASEIAAALDGVVVEHSLSLPDMFVLTFLDEQRVLLERTFRIGADVTVKVGGAALRTTELITGEVTAVEAEYDGTGMYTVVRGYDKGHRLQRGRKVRTFLNATYTDVVTKVLGEAGLQRGTLESVGPTHAVVSQNNISDWDFLMGLAREVGFFAGTLDGKFHFKKPEKASSGPAPGSLRSATPTQLVHGENLLRFRGVASAVEQVEQVHVRSWDPRQKKEVVGQANATRPQGAQAGGDTDPKALAGKFNGMALLSVAVPDHDRSAADNEARGIVDALASATAELDGTAYGDPRLKAGQAVSVSLMGKPFDGKYVLTTTRHVHDPREGYLTAFTVTGPRDNSLWGLANGGLPAGAPPVQGVVIALVTNNKDPDKLLRVKLRFPWLSDDYESDWARLVQLGAGADRGSVVVPEVNDEVLVAFDHGDIRRPYVLGGVYNGKDKPHLGPGGAVEESGGKIAHRTVTSRTHQTIALLDKSGEQGVTIVTGDGKQELCLKQGDKKITLTGEGDVEVSAKGSGKVTMDAMGDVTIKTKANVTIESTGNTKIKATGNLDLEGAMVNVKSQGPLSLKGAIIKLN